MWNVQYKFKPIRIGGSCRPRPRGDSSHSARTAWRQSHLHVLAVHAAHCGVHCVLGAGAQRGVALAGVDAALAQRLLDLWAPDKPAGLAVNLAMGLAMDGGCGCMDMHGLGWVDGGPRALVNRRGAGTSSQTQRPSVKVEPASKQASSAARAPAVHAAGGVFCDGQRPPQHALQHVPVTTALLRAAPHTPGPQGCRRGRQVAAGARVRTGSKLCWAVARRGDGS